MYFRETNCVIYWIVIYPADSVIHLLSNSALERREQRSLMSGNPYDKYGETFHSLNGTGTLYGDAVLQQVTEWVLSNELIKSKREWNYVRIPRTKGPPPALPIPRLRRPCVNRQTKLVSLIWVRFFFSLLVNVHDLTFFFAIFQNKRWKIVRFCLFVCLFSIYWKKGKITRNTCHFFHLSC